jgi:hypothetical protein
MPLFPLFSLSMAAHCFLLSFNLSTTIYQLARESMTVARSKRPPRMYHIYRFGFLPTPAPDSAPMSCRPLGDAKRRDRIHAETECQDVKRRVLVERAARSAVDGYGRGKQRHDRFSRSRELRSATLGNSTVRTEDRRHSRLRRANRRYLHSCPQVNPSGDGAGDKVLMLTGHTTALTRSTRDRDTLGAVAVAC